MEKRTIFYGDISSFFGDNDVVMEKVMLATSRTTNDVPFITRFLSEDDRWHIMNIVMNRISALFGPFHIFFNEARRCKSNYQSAWYLFSISCQQNVHHGRFFVTPYRPVLSRVDMGVKRLRIDLVSESEMRDICSGPIKPPEWGFFNNRHKYRWEILVKMSELFENQLVILDRGDLSPQSLERVNSKDESDWYRQLIFEDGNERSEDEEEEDDENVPASDISPKSPSSWHAVSEQAPSRLWSPSRQESLEKHSSNPREKAREAALCGRRCSRKRNRESDNCIMRVHIPFLSSEPLPACAKSTSEDVVLFS